MGIGDVTLPLAPAVIEAMQKAVAEMGVKETFRGYGPEQGYDFLHEAIAGYYAGFGVSVASDEISDGAKSDCGNMTDIFSNDNVILIPDPVYPVYLDTNVMCGRKIIYMQGKPENDFLPMPDDSVKADIIYLCSPNNPTGAVYTKEQLEKWVAYALKNDAVILYDAAYESFISDPEIPRSIFAVEGAKKCAIELCSLSKTAGFTGTRCGYTIVPQKKARNSAAKCWLFIKKMPALCRKRLPKKALSSTAAHIPRISGCSAPTAWVPGSFSIICWKNWLLSVLRAQASVPWVKVISA